MEEPEPTREELKRRQLAQEQAALEAKESAVSEEGALTHERRADKARYLREKLEQQRRAEDED